MTTTKEPTVDLRYRCLRDLVRLAEQDIEIDEALVRAVRWEEEIIRQAMDTPHAVVSPKFPAGYFEVADYRKAWKALQDSLPLIKRGQTVPPGQLLDRLAVEDPKYFAGVRGQNWLRFIMAQEPCGMEYAIEQLLPTLHSRYQMKHWAERNQDFINRAHQAKNPLEVQTEWRIEAYRMSMSHDGGALGKSVAQMVRAWDPHNKENRNIVPTGIPQVDRANGGGHGRGELMVIGGGTNHGKCLRRGTGVLMHSGEIRKVEDIFVGEKLMGPDGRPREVLSTNVGEGEMFEIRPNKGSSWFCNEEHILTLVGTGSRAPTASERRKGRTGTRYGGTVVDVPVCEWLRWSKKRKSNFKLMRADVVEFSGPIEELPIEPYFLGVLLGDGCIQQATPKVTTVDPQIVAEVERQATKFGLRVHRNYIDRAAPTYSLSGKRGGGSGDGPVPNPITVQLEALGLAGTGSGNKFIPAAYKTASIADRLALLAGLIDTDGACNLSAYDYVSKSKDLSEDVAFVARSLGMAAYVSECKKSCQTGAVGTYYRVGLTGDTVADIPCRIPRKRLPARRSVRDVLRTGFTVVPTGKAEPYHGFMIDGDGRFLLDDFTVTHNSYMAEYMMRLQARLGQRALYISTEDSEELFTARFIADFAVKYETREIRAKEADPDAINVAQDAAVLELRDRLYYFHAKKWSCSRVCDIIRRHAFLLGIDIVIVDYLQAITPDEVSNQKANDTALIVGQLKACCDEVGVALVLLSQYARDEYRNGQEPTITSCKWAGEIENESEIMILLWRDDNDILHSKLAKLKWAKKAGRRYTIEINDQSGCFGDWVDDFSETVKKDQQERRGRYRSGGGGGNAGGTI